MYFDLDLKKFLIGYAFSGPTISVSLGWLEIWWPKKGSQLYTDLYEIKQQKKRNG